MDVKSELNARHQTLTKLPNSFKYNVNNIIHAIRTCFFIRCVNEYSRGLLKMLQQAVNVMQPISYRIMPGPPGPDSLGMFNRT